MKTFGCAVASLLLVSGGAQAGEMADFMCLHYAMPITVDAISDGAISLTIENNSPYDVLKAAIDIGSGSSAFEATILVDFDAALNAGSVRNSTTSWDLNDKQISLLQGVDQMRASISNALTTEKERVIVREDIGPSFVPHWPNAPKTALACK